MGFSSFISGTSETSEMHDNRSLRSHYYKTSYTKAKEAMVQYANLNGLEVKHVDDTHKELFLQAPLYHIIASFVQINPIETSIDLKIETYTIIGFNRPMKKILNVYRYLDKNLEFKGVGLHP
jgi:hypothetical protein